MLKLQKFCQIEAIIILTKGSVGKIILPSGGRMVSKALLAKISNTSSERKPTACTYWQQQLLFAHLQYLRVINKKPAILIITVM